MNGLDQICYDCLGKVFEFIGTDSICSVLVLSSEMNEHPAVEKHVVELQIDALCDIFMKPEFQEMIRKLKVFNNTQSMLGNVSPEYTDKCKLQIAEALLCEPRLEHFLRKSGEQFNLAALKSKLVPGSSRDRFLDTFVSEMNVIRAFINKVHSA